VFEPEATTSHREDVNMMSEATEAARVGRCARERGLCERCVLAGGESGPFRRSLDTADQDGANPCKGKSFNVLVSPNWEVKRKSRSSFNDVPH